jgi:glucokinase
MKYIIGIDLGGTNIKAGLVKADTGEVVTSTSIKTESEKGIEDTFSRIANLVETILKENGIEKSNVQGVGMGIPGPVMHQAVVGFFANFPWEKDVDAKALLEGKIGIPVKVDNDVNVIAAGEAWLGAAKGYKNVVCLALGTGVGGGIIINGNLVDGFRGAGGEIGHMVVEADGKLCGCGHKGCLETYCSATGIIREATSRLTVNKKNKVWELIDGDITKLEAKHVFDAAKAGDEFAIDLVNYLVKYLAIGIGNLMNIVNPEAIVIGGGVALAGDILFNPLKEEIKKTALAVAINGVKIVPAVLGNDAGVVGAAALFA